METANPDDRLGALMTRYQAGEVAAFEEIYSSTADGVHGYLGRWVGREAADDLVQETFLRLVKARRTYRSGMPFRPWLFAIARHVALAARRTHRRRFSREIGVVELPETPVAAPGVDHMEGVRLAAAVARLPEDQREVVWLARVEGMTSSEIARIVGASPGAVKVRLHRAEAKLRASWRLGTPAREDS